MTYTEHASYSDYEYAILGALQLQYITFEHWVRLADRLCADNDMTMVAGILASCCALQVEHVEFKASPSYSPHERKLRARNIRALCHVITEV